MSDFRPLILSASAGSGKTFRLSNRYIQLILAGERPDRILATTFTRKAAGEIRSRIFSRLAGALDSPESLKRFSNELGLENLKREDVIRVLEELLRVQHRLGICTNDTLLVSMARSFSFELGLAPGWSIASNDQARQIVNQAVQATISEAGHDELLELLLLLNNGERRTRIIDRLRVLTSANYSVFLNSEKEAWYWLKPESTTSEKEIRLNAKRVRDLEIPLTQAKTPAKPFEKAFHAASQILTRGDLADFLELTIVQQSQSEPYKFGQMKIPDEVRELFSELATMTAPIVLQRLGNSTAAAYTLLKHFAGNYQKLSGDAGCITFSDVKSTLARELDAGSLEEIYYRLDSRYHHLLFDEFQDTSDSEWRLLKPMVSEILSKAQGEHSFFCVGDLKQAIYGWRGGRAGIFRELSTRWEISTEAMPESRRSAKQIIDFVNQVFTNLPKVPLLEEYSQSVAEWMEGFEEHRTVKNEIGYVQVEAVQSDSESEHPLLDRACEIVREVIEDAPSASIGVLVRSNEAIAEFIGRFNVPGQTVLASGEGGNPLTDSQAVRDVLALLLALDHPAHTIHRFHAIEAPIGKVAKISHETFALRSSEIRADLLRRGYGTVIGEWISNLSAAWSGRELRRLNGLVELAFEFDRRRGVRPREFVEFVRSEKVEDLAASRVRVMTIHQAKGLEFDVVVVPQLESKLFQPTIGQVFSDRCDENGAPARVIRGLREIHLPFDERLAEIWRESRGRVVLDNLSVLYVALTRARTAMFVVVPERKEKSTSHNLAGVVCEAIGSPVAPPGVLLEAGDVEWHNAFQIASSKTAMRPESIHFNWAKRSKLADLRLEIIERRVKESATSWSTQRGEELHWLAEQIGWIEETDFKEEKFLSHPRMDEFQSMLKKGDVAKCFSRMEQEGAGEKVKVYRELPFSLVREGKVLSGRIDRLVLYERGGIIERADVIDFKSDRITVDRAQEVARTYQDQLEPYRIAASRFAGISIERVSAKILFLEIGTAVEI